jgi:hypothetical protein
MTLSEVIELEKAWLKTLRADEKAPTIDTSLAEQKAYGLYSEACDETGKCLMAYCRRITRGYAYCPEHSG